VEKERREQQKKRETLAETRPSQKSDIFEGFEVRGRIFEL
jgi:hypothetical protein